MNRKSYRYDFPTHIALFILSVAMMAALGILALLLFTVNPANAAEVIYTPGRFPQVFSSEKVLAGNSTTSEAIYIGDAQGNFSLQYAISGNGTIKIEYLLSLDNSNYLEPSTASDIGAGLTNSSGPNANGKDILSFGPALAEKIKLKITETSSTDNATIDLYLGRQ